ncbi:hypothetical protein SDC9_176221 [bioreactor metagenome]|uniref:Uncharacterized protein n=1 Tax=bioreactor metagenome TaxID=1076179 RepID=A0A645GRE2_9ZZZZ
MLPELVLFHGGGQLIEPAAHHHLVRPGHLVADDDRGVGRIAAGQQLLLQGVAARRGQVERHRGAVGGEFADTLARRHRRAAALQPGEDQRLRDLRQGDLDIGAGCGGGEGRDTRNRLVGDSEPAEQFALFGGGAVDGRVAGVYASDQQALVAGPLVEGGDVFERG